MSEAVDSVDFVSLNSNDFHQQCGFVRRREHMNDVWKFLKSSLPEFTLPQQMPEAAGDQSVSMVSHHITQFIIHSKRFQSYNIFLLI